MVTLGCSAHMLKERGGLGAIFRCSPLNAHIRCPQSNTGFQAGGQQHLRWRRQRHHGWGEIPVLAQRPKALSSGRRRLNLDRRWHPVRGVQSGIRSVRSVSSVLINQRCPVRAFVLYLQGHDKTQRQSRPRCIHWCGACAQSLSHHEASRLFFPQ